MWKTAFFSIKIFFHGHWRLTGQRGRKGNIFYFTLLLPPTQKHSDIYFATLHVRWLSHISNRTARIYQVATQWDLPPYIITIWLIYVMLIFVCFPVDLIQGFPYSYLTLETGGLELTSTIIIVLQANRLTKRASVDHITSNFLKPVFHNLYLVHSWILCSICNATRQLWNEFQHFLNRNLYILYIPNQSRVPSSGSLIPATKNKIFH